MEGKSNPTIYAYVTEGEPLQIYSDPAYGCNRSLCLPFLGASPPPQEK